MELMPHQQRIVDMNPRKILLNWEMRCGKTLPATIWVDHHCRSGNTYIITPKSNKEEWKRYGTNATVLSKEEFKKTELGVPTAIVIDEAHHFASALFQRRGKGRSQLADKLYNLVRRYPEMDVMLLTATPVRNDAWSLHTLLCYIGVYYDWKKWRDEFFELRRMPFLKFPAYFPRVDWRKQLQPYLRKHTDIVSLRDIVEYLPPATDEVVVVKHKKKYAQPKDEVVTWVHEHLWEQTDKAEAILQLGYRKLIVVCKYTEQIDALAVELGKEKPVFILDGRTKDADSVKLAAQSAEECYFILQSSMGFGFDGYMFGAIVFASMDHSCVNHTQMRGRLRSVQHLQPVTYVYLIGGKWDRRVYDTVMAGNDFNPHNYHD